MFSFTVVATRYSEDVKWLETVPSVVMNKGDPKTIPDSMRSRVCNIPNVGTEEYGYLHYIIDNYHQLPDVVVFSQGDISDHKDSFIPFASDAWMNKTKYIGDDVDSYTDSLQPHEIVLQLVKQVHMYGFTQNALIWKYSDETLDIIPTLSFKRFFEGKEQWIVEYQEWFKEFVFPTFPSPKEFMWFKNALFGVQKRYILSRPLEYWKRLLAEVDAHPWNVCHFERSWYYIMNCNSYMREEIAPFTWTNFFFVNVQSWRHQLWYNHAEPWNLHMFVNLFFIIQSKPKWNILDVGGDDSVAAFLTNLRFSKCHVHMHLKPIDKVRKYMLHLNPDKIIKTISDATYDIIHISGTYIIKEEDTFDVCECIRTWSNTQTLIIINDVYDDRVHVVIECILSKIPGLQRIDMKWFETYMGQAHHVILKWS